MKTSPEKLLFYGFHIIAGSALIFGALREEYLANRVEQGYIKPRNIEVKTEDSNHNGLRETIIKVDNKKYLLKYNENGMPTICPYTTKVEQEKF